MGELGPCPFCDGTDIRIDKHTSMRSPTGAIFSMCCYNCGATFPNRYKRELLVDAWNRRPLPAQQERTPSPVSCGRCGDLERALGAAEGYLLNAKIDLETGATKKTAIATIEGGLRVVRAARTGKEC